MKMLQLEIGVSPIILARTILIGGIFDLKSIHHV